jgi:hypothetical protein
MHPHMPRCSRLNFSLQLTPAPPAPSQPPPVRAESSPPPPALAACVAARLMLRPPPRPRPSCRRSPHRLYKPASLGSIHCSLNDTIMLMYSKYASESGSSIENSLANCSTVTCCVFGLLSVVMYRPLPGLMGGDAWKIGCATAMKKLRIVTLRLARGDSKKVLERWTKPKLSRRTCTCEYALQIWRGKSAGVAKRPRERSPTRNP